MSKVVEKIVYVYKGGQIMTKLRKNIYETIRTTQYDQQVKKLLSNNRVIAYLLKAFDSSYQSDTLDQIIQKYLLKDPRKGCILLTIEQ